MRCNLSFLPSNFVELKIVTLLVVTCSHLLFSERSSFMAAFFLCLRLGCKSYSLVIVPFVIHVHAICCTVVLR